MLDEVLGLEEVKALVLEFLEEFFLLLLPKVVLSNWLVSSHASGLRKLLLKLALLGLGRRIGSDATSSEVV